jgi:hypothetical protein
MPSNLWNGDPQVNPYVGARQITARIADYIERGILVPPGKTSIALVKSIPDIM